MVKLPNGERATVDPSKIESYLLDTHHRVGRHKAHVFSSALRLQSGDAGTLVAALRQAAANEEAAAGVENTYGAQYTIEFTMTHGGRSAAIRSIWIVRSDEDFPRFVTAYVANRSAANE